MLLFNYSKGKKPTISLDSATGENFQRANRRLATYKDENDD